MIIDVLTRVASDTGYHPTQKRQALLNLLNNSAREMYDSLECNHIYREVTCVVPRDKLVSLPSMIGDLRGVRAHTEDMPFPIQSMSAPRYVDNRWNYKIRNWRELGHSPVHTYVASVGVLTLETQAIPGNQVFRISGQTSYADRIEEEITFDETPKVSLSAFGPDIYQLSCIEERNFNIIVKDAEQNEIAVLYNTENETRYLIVDVSQVFWSKDTTEDESLVDICYKHPLWKFTKDTDKFPAGSRYDNAWYHLCMHKFFSPMENRKADSSEQRALYSAAMVEAKGGAESGIEKRVSFGENKFYNLIRRGYSPNYLYPFGNNWNP